MSDTKKPPHPILVSLSPEEFGALPRIPDAVIQAALDEGYRQAYGDSSPTTDAELLRQLDEIEARMDEHNEALADMMRRGDRPEDSEVGRKLRAAIEKLEAARAILLRLVPWRVDFTDEEREIIEAARRLAWKYTGRNGAGS